MRVPVRDPWSGHMSKSSHDDHPIPATLPIAIIGMSCHFAGDATNLESLWDLCANGGDAWSEIPEDRFHKNAFYHPNSNKLGCMNVEGAYFLKEDIALFDASFFNLTTDTAAAMDPQVRLQLESVYEALENAGLSIQSIAGSDTSVYIGSFSRDYSDSLNKDVELLPSSYLTGNSPAMLSNRISHFFDLRGPSMTLDTGCSGSLTALHLACQSLRAGDAKISIVGGSNILLNPDVFIYMTNLGFLSPDGKCYAWDSRASGYARGEGVATIVIKPLPDALRDGDHIHAVIRETTLSQDGKTPTITRPSPEAQEQLIRDCYRRAGLDPRETSYVEAHMTGTQAGDPVEASSIGKVFREGRLDSQELLVGSIKTNIGHTENVSGLAGIIKVALALQKGAIPPNLHFEKPNPKINLKKLKLKVPNRLESWPGGQLLRASVNNFGYGGANAHCIVEHAKYHTLPVITNVSRRTHSKNFRLFILSAKDAKTTKAMILNIKNYVQKLVDEHKDISLEDLAYTLGERRTIFPWVATAVADSIPGIIKALEDSNTQPFHATKIPTLGFVFNGQGAQWYGMGRELISRYPVYGDAIREADKCLREFGATWSLYEELMRDESTTKVNQLAMSQPICVAIQICLVRLLSSWGIKPAAVTSHSSGEVAAAYAAGAITFKEAIGIMFFRGTITAKYQKESQSCGGMLAAGLSEDDAEEYISKLTSGIVVVACINSPSSVTISGDLSAIDELEKILSNDKIFARKLKVATAYHSHHMEAMAAEYLAKISSILDSNSSRSFGGIRFSSPVTGRLLPSARELNPQHWVKNLVQPVLFSDALMALCFGTGSFQEYSHALVDVLVEIGPHGVLGGPIRQTLSHSGLEKASIAYGSCLMRNQDATQTIQNLAALLVEHGYPVDMNSINSTPGFNNPHVLPYLPPYPWNHSMQYWIEPRINAETRMRESPYHDLLGARLVCSNAITPVWRHYIRSSDLPWVRDHRILSDIIYPAAGFIAMAIEAMLQISRSSRGQTSEGYKLRDIELMSALVVPDDSQGVEVQISIRNCDQKELDADDWKEFRIHSVSVDNQTWIEHCKGFIAPKFKSFHKNDLSGGSRRGSTSIPMVPDSSIKQLRPEDFFESCNARGLKYGPAFRNFESINANNKNALSTLVIRDISPHMPHGFFQDHLIHPTTLDSIIQVAFAAAFSGGAFKGAALLPNSIRRMYVSCKIEKNAGHLQVHTRLDEVSDQGFKASTIASSKNTGHVVEMDGIFYQSLNNTLPAESTIPDQKTCIKFKWQPDISLAPEKYLMEMLSSSVDQSEIEIDKKLQCAVYHLVRDALVDLTDRDVDKLEPFQQRFYNWMKALSPPVGFHSSNLRLSKTCRQRLYDEVSSESINGKSACLIGKQLAAILRQEVSSISLLKRNNIFNDYNENSIRYDRSFAQVRTLVQLIGAKNPRLKVLEIGAKTGTCTSFILDGLGGEMNKPQFSHYDFTDPIPENLEFAKEKFTSWDEMISYQVLDIEVDISGQSLEFHSYDLVVACQSLHTCRSIRAALMNIQKLLKPGGRLIIVEHTIDTPDYHLTFGTSSESWADEEPERKLSPIISVPEWQKLLYQTGFESLQVQIPDCENKEHSSVTVMMSTTSSKERNYPSNVTLVYNKLPPPPVWLDQIKRAIRKITLGDITIQSLRDLQANGQTCIYLGDMDHPILGNMDVAEFQALKNMVLHARGILWVSYGAGMHSNEAERCLHQGFLRTLRMEDKNKRYIMLNLDSAEKKWSSQSSNAIIDIFKAAFDYGQKLEDIDTEYAQRDSVIQISRLHEDPEENVATSLVPQTQQLHTKYFCDTQHQLTLSTKTRGLLDNIHFIDGMPRTEPLPSDYVEVEPKAFGLNFRDVLVATGQLKEFVGEFSGVVTKLGSQTSQSGLRIGDRVLSPGVGSWSNVIRLHWHNLARIPDGLSYEEAASIPTVFITAYYGLLDVARLNKEESVLIHAATGGVGQAAINIARHVGAEIFVTVSTEEKRQFIMENYGIPESHIFSSRDSSFAPAVMAMTKGRGVDVVLNSLAGALLKHSWECIAQFGRFIEIGKRDILASKHISLAPMERVATFAAIDIKKLGEYKGEVLHRVMKELLILLKNGSIKLVKPIKTYAISDIESAFRLMQAGKHLGKIIIKPNIRDTVKALNSGTRALFSSEKSYLIVGGLGGIGKSITKRLAELQAKNLVLASRSAENQPDCLAFKEKLEKMGCKVLLQNCNVSNSADVRLLVSNVAQKMPPIRGVIQAAVVLEDSVFESMTFDQWTNTIQPKVHGTRNLHTYLPDLDFFIMLSSLTGVAGNASQAGYTAASTFQDAFARYRISLGLPAVSIDLGSVKDVGLVSRRNDVAERLERSGYEALEEEKVLKIIESAIRNPMREVDLSQIITGVKSFCKNSTVIFNHDMRFSSLEKKKNSTNSEDGDTKKSQDIFDDLLPKVTTTIEATELVTAAMVRKISEMFSISEDEIDKSKSMGYYGVDSLVAIEVRYWLTMRAKIEISIFDVLQVALTDLAKKIVEKRGWGSISKN